MVATLDLAERKVANSNPGGGRGKKVEGVHLVARGCVGPWATFFNCLHCAVAVHFYSRVGEVSSYVAALRSIGSNVCQVGQTKTLTRPESRTFPIQTDGRVGDVYQYGSKRLGLLILMGPGNHVVLLGLREVKW